MGTKEECCIKCGMTVAVEKPPHIPIPQEPKKEAAPVAPKAPEPPKPPDPPKPVKVFKALDLVIIAIDPTSMADMTKESLIKNSMAKDVIVCIDGPDFISTIMSIIKHDKSPSLVMLSVSLPRLNGLDTALAMRYMEKGGNIQSPIPIIFISASQEDVKFAQRIFSLKPTDYLLYKEADASKFDTMLANSVQKQFPDNYEYKIIK